MTEIFTQLFSIGTILLQGVLICTLIAYITRNRYSLSKRWIQVVQRGLQQYGLQIGFITSLTAMLGSLYYSEFAGYTPCVLCWYQRIFMYALVLLFGLAIVRKEWVIRPYALLLSLVGAGIALFHYTEQVSSNPIAPCSTLGYAVSCSQYYMMNYGYITIPMMALTLFVFIAGSMWLAKKA